MITAAAQVTKRRLCMMSQNSPILFAVGHNLHEKTFSDKPK